MKKSKDILIALDQGSGSSRALAVDEKWRVVARSQRSVRTFYPRAGWVEHDADDLRRSQEYAMDRVLSSIPGSSNVVGLGISCQRSTLVLWDSRTGRPLGRAPSWQDGRAASIAAEFQGRQQEIHDKTGLYCNPYYSAPKLKWLLENDRKVRLAADQGFLRVGPIATYLLWHWTKGEVFATDPTLAQRTLLFNLRALNWDQDLLSAFGISRGWLPKIVPSVGTWAAFKRGGRKISVLAVLGDQQAAAFGLGAESPSAAIVNYGTGAFFLLNVGAEDRRVPGILTSVAWQAAGKSCDYFLEGTVHAVGTSYQWLKDNLGLLKNIKQVDALCRKSTQRILALIAIGGLGAPRWDYSTYTTFLGLNSRTRPEDMVRAVTEGIAFLVADIASALRAAGYSIDSIRAAGGLSRLESLLQAEADLLQVPLMRMRETEATAIGVAALAARQAGLAWHSAPTAVVEKEFRPKISSDQASNLLQGWRLFVETEQKLSVQLRRLDVLA